MRRTAVAGFAVATCCAVHAGLAAVLLGTLGGWWWAAGAVAVVVAVGTVRQRKTVEVRTGPAGLPPAQQGGRCSEADQKRSLVRKARDRRDD